MYIYTSSLFYSLSLTKKVLPWYAVSSGFPSKATAPPEKQLVFENTHPAIIDPETWEIIRRMREHKRHSPHHGNPGLFSGVAYCSDCGSKLYFHTRAIHNKAKS